MNRYEMSADYSYSLGMSLTIEALKMRSDQMIKVVLSEKAYKNEQLSYLLKLCEEYAVAYEYDEKTIQKLSAKENCYCIGFFRKYRSTLQSDNHIVLCNFRDLSDLGTVLRSAVSFDLKDIVIITNDLDLFDPRCIRASMGSFFHCNIVRYASIQDYLADYKTNNIYPFVSEGKCELSQMELQEPYSILISYDYKGLDTLFENGYYIGHESLDEISLSIRTSIIFSQIYHLKRSR